MRRRLPRHGPRPLRPAHPAGGTAHRLRCLPGRLARQQPPEGGPQLRPDRQGHADGRGRPRRGEGAGRPLLGVQPLRRLRRHGAPLRPARRPHQRPRQGPPVRADGGLRRRLHRGRPRHGARRRLREGRPQARRAGRHARPAARHLGHHARRRPREPAAGGGRRGRTRAEPHLHRHVPHRRPDLPAGRAVRVDGRVRAADGRADLAAAGEPAARPPDLLDPVQRPLPAASAAAAGHLLLPAQPGRPGPASAVQRRGRRDPGPRPRGRRCGRGRRRPLRRAPLHVRPAAHLRRHRCGAAERGGDAGGDPAARDPYGEAARRQRTADQHGVHRAAADRDDEGDRRRGGLLPQVGRAARHHAGGAAAARGAERLAGGGRPDARHAQQRAHPVDRRYAGGRGPHIRRSAGRLPGAGHPVHRADHPPQRRRGPHPGLRGRRGPAEGRRELPGGPAVRPPAAPPSPPAGCTAMWSWRTSPSATARSTSPC